MKKVYLFTLMMLVLMFFSATVGVAQVSLTASGGTLTGSYSTLKGAFDAINAGTHTGTIAITISGNTAETASAVLNASGTVLSSYTAVSIEPSGTAAINGNIFGYLIDLNGADNVTFNGLNTPGNSLVISNTGTASASTIRLYNDATNNLITRCSVLGSTIISGVINFGTGISTGNDNNTVSFCNIGPASTDLPICGIYSFGTSVSVDNSNNTVTDNNIYDYYNASGSTAGMNINNNNSAWTITNNRLYQTANRVFTSAGTHYGIFINSGSGYSITGNTIGYANASGSGTTNLIGLSSGSLTGTFPSAYATGGVAIATRYAAIYCTFLAGGTVSSIQGNTVAGFAIYTSFSSSSTFGIFGGIAVASGNANIGTVTGNTIGTPAASIYTSSTSSGGAICGIYVNSANTVNVQGNTLQNLDAMGTLATATGAMNCINIEGTGGTINVSGNTIGGSANPSLRMGNLTLATGQLSNVGTIFGTASGSGAFQGIRVTNSGTVTIGSSGSGNIIRNASQNSTNVLAVFRGVLVSGGTTNVSYNTIQNLTGNTAGVSYGSGGLAGVGILMASGALSPVVSNNTISGLSLTNAGSLGYTLAGIVYHNPATAVTVSKNIIFGLSNASASTSVTLPGTATGIFISNGAGVPNMIDNNMISLGNGQTTNTTFIGIWAQNVTSGTATTLKIYHNSVNIEGTVGIGLQPSMCFQRGDLINAGTVLYTIDAKNNLFNNTRSGGTGKHYAMTNGYGIAASSATGWGANASNYNVLNGNGATIGYWSGDQSFSGWQTASACDGNSRSAIPVTFVNSAGGDLHINMGFSPTQLESGCVAIAGITTDIDGDARPGPVPSRFGGGTAPDFGADEFDGVPTNLPLLILSGTPNDITCSGMANGTISTVVSGGVAPYNYAWSTGAVTPGLFGLAAGTYTVTVTDAITSAITGSWTINEPAAMLLSTSVTAASCPASADGSVDISVTGGTPALTYYWSNLATTEDIAGLSAGTYSVTVTDASGCYITGNWTVTVASSVCPTLPVSGDVTTTVCYNATQTIFVAGDPNTFTVQDGGSATFIAGQNIFFYPGTRVFAGGYMLGTISTSYCGTKAPMLPTVAAGAEEPSFTPGFTSLTIYPNPTSGNFTLVQKGEHAYGAVKVEVYSMKGEKIMTEQMIGEKSHEFQFSGMPAGIYFVKVVADNYVETIKLIKSR
ncbi:MAG: T9SS type A sorting domain-containing protein [Bacteroidetes bacterium]|nr:T9SS type A sorting domain-containing protein [Bacteroidota bacterium]